MKTYTVYMAHQDTDFDTKLGRAIRAARVTEKLSQTQLANRVKISRASLSNYERGRPVPVKTLSAIAMALRIKPSYFFAEAEREGKEYRGQVAARQRLLEQIRIDIESASIRTLDAIHHVLDLGRPR